MGIDIEKLIPQERFDSIAKLVTTELDKFYLKDCNSKDLQLVQSILFSGKESLYKAIFPYFKQYFGFQEASLLEVDLKNQEFTLQINSESELRKFNGKYQGKYNLIQDHLLTSIVLKYTE